MKLFVAGVSCKTAPVELREKLAVSPASLRCLGCRLKVAGELTELVVVSTCNRVELYGVAPRANSRVPALFDVIAGQELDLSAQIYVHSDEATLRHLLKVASGLDSMVLGETEITGQVKQAYQSAHESKLTGRVLNRAFQTALQVAKEIRTHTAIGRGATSVGSVAVELAEKIFGPQFADKTVMIVGAGKMGEACVRHLAKKGLRSVLVSNRSFERAQELAREFAGRAVRFDDCLRAMIEADIVVSSTGAPRTILDRAGVESVMKARRQRPLFLIDIAVPRDIAADVQSLENVYLYNIDNLETIVRENVRLREQELAQCQAIVSARAAALMARLASALQSTPVAAIRGEPGHVRPLTWPLLDSVRAGFALPATS
jgi:glutamyl-tRNA reductase